MYVGSDIVPIENWLCFGFWSADIEQRLSSKAPGHLFRTLFCLFNRPKQHAVYQMETWYF
jgi:hypothetical protein